MATQTYTLRSPLINSSPVPVDEATPVCTTSQLTSLLFIVPWALAFHQERLFLSWILLVNTCVSLLVHRPARPAEHTSLDDVNNSVVGAWVAANIMLLTENLPAAYAWAGIGCAVGIVLCRSLRFDYTSGVRTFINSMTQFFGAAGTTLLLVGSKHH